MESAMYGTESAAGMMVCPKCGFEQDERQECLKCGIVFSKFYALFPDGKEVDAEIPDDAVTQDSGDQDQKAMIADLQRQIREMNSRFSEVDFEKAERNRLRADLKDLELRLQANMEQMAERFEQCEARIGEGSTAPVQQEGDGALHDLLDRLNQLEEQLKSVVDASPKINELEDKHNSILQQVTGLEEQFSGAREEVADIKSKLEQILEVQEAAEPRTPIEDDVHAIRKYLDEFRQILSQR
jgi:chromosome segregation ATPase